MDYVAMDALISDCERYRWMLFRRWSNEPSKLVMFVGLNPSTADAYEDDPTIRRCVGFAQKWGCSGMYMMNAYAFRATDPKVMKAQQEPVGVYNDEHLKAIASMCSIHVACWGANIETWRQNELLKMLPRLKCFGTTKGGFPKHPLYLAGSAVLVPFGDTGVT